MSDIELKIALEMILAGWRREKERAAILADNTENTDIPLTRYLVLAEHIGQIEKVLGYE